MEKEGKEMEEDTKKKDRRGCGAGRQISIGGEAICTLIVANIIQYQQLDITWTGIN